jgi:CBS domain-containing protein
MSMTAADIMNREIHHVAPEMPLPELERSFLARAVSAFPVFDEGKLVGIVSRSDVVRQLCLEQSHAEIIAAGRSEPGSESETEKSTEADDIDHHIGRRITSLTVGNVMIGDPVSVSPTTPLAQLAAEMVRRHIHSLLVLEGAELVGIITAFDLVRMVSDGRLA